jgi:hypothetical protein
MQTHVPYPVKFTVADENISVFRLDGFIFLVGHVASEPTRSVQFLQAENAPDRSSL